MVAKIIFTLGMAVGLTSCYGQNKQEKEDLSVEPVEIHRFDQTLFRLIESNDSTLEPALLRDYPGMLDVIGKGILNIQTPEAPDFFPKLLRFYSEPALKNLYRDALAQYDTIADIQCQLGEGFAYLKTYFPTMQIPAVYMHVSGFNQNVLVGDSLLSLSIDKYLGDTYPLYQDFFYDYQQRKMQRSHVVPDYLAGWIMSEYPFTGKENVLLDRMIYEGKINYLVSQAFPLLSPALLMGYTEEAYAWCTANEKEIWKAMVERKHLYTPDQITTSKYFEDTPCSFLSNEAPGNLGGWIGWQIVRNYMEKTGSTPEALMRNTDAQDILAGSKYKPS